VKKMSSGDFGDLASRLRQLVKELSRLQRDLARERARTDRLLDQLKRRPLARRK
jgi:hypothetical protein